MMTEKVCVLLVFSIIFTATMVTIPHTASAPSPQGWYDDQRLTDLDHNYSDKPRMAIDSMNNIHIVWNDNRHGPGELYYMKIDGEGNVLVDERPVSDLDSAQSTLGDIDVDSQDNIHIIWSDVRHTGAIPNLELYYEKLDVNGNTLVDDLRITFAAYLSHYPSLAVDSADNVHIAYCEEIDVGTLQEEVHYIKLDNDGNILVDDTAVTPADGEESLFPDIAVDSNDEVHIVWLDDRNETGVNQCQDYYYSKLDNTGGTLVDDTMVFKNGDHYRPSIALDSDDNVQMVISNRWFLATNEKKHLYYMKLDNVGNTMIDWKRLSVSEENASHARFAFDSLGNLHIAWEDERHGYPEIYYMELDDTGNIITDELRLTDEYYNSTSPVIALNRTDGKHVVWADDRDDMYFYELYHKRSIPEPVNQVPTVHIDVPSEGDEVSGNVTMEGRASDTDGTVQAVQVKIVGDWEDAVGTTEWTFTWNTSRLTNGPYTIRARSYDGTNHSFEEVRNVTVYNEPPNVAPTVTISPLHGEVSGTVEINGTASDPEGHLRRVEVRIDDGSWITAAGTSKWKYHWDTTGEMDGEHVIYARAQDGADEHSGVIHISASVNNWVNTPPEVSITSVTGGFVSGIVEFRGSASDFDGDETILSVEVNVGDGWENAHGTSQWSYTWDTGPLDDGDYMIRVRAYDGYDHSDVASTTIRVDNPHPPSVAITSAVPDEVSGTLTLRGTALDEDGEITTIEIQVDDGEWAVFSDSGQWSYELDTTELSNGEHTIRIRVNDDEGEYAIESATINVDNPEDIPQWPFILGFAVLVLLVIIIGLGLRRRTQ